MKALYLESSALLAWLLGQRAAERVRSEVDGATFVVTSTLTIAEAGRTLARGEASGALRAADVQRLRGLLERVSHGWMTIAVTDEVLERVARAFPVEPVRTLDAIHLATALTLVRAIPELKVLTFDKRIRENCEALGLS